jgi:hypothetical protein
LRGPVEKARRGAQVHRSVSVPGKMRGLVGREWGEEIKRGKPSPGLGGVREMTEGWCGGGKTIRGAGRCGKFTVPPKATSSHQEGRGFWGKASADGG